MLDQLHLRTRLRRAGPIAAVLLTAVVLVPSASSGTYADPSGDNVGAAGDIGAVTVSSDKTSGQILFTIAGANLASSTTNVLFVDIDADANPLTGSINDSGAEFEFMIDNDSYSFSHWDGSQWVDAPYSTVRVTSNPNQVTISVNRSELGNTTDFNFVATSFSLTFSGNVPVIGLDVAPNDGAYNYSLQVNGPQVNSVDLQTTPSTGPKAGKRFTVVPTALHLPPDGRTI